MLGIYFVLEWLCSIIRVVKNDFKTPNNKIVWLILLLLLPPIGTVLFLFIGNNQMIDNGKNTDKDEDERLYRLKEKARENENCNLKITF
jgi:hypothetical protein